MQDNASLGLGYFLRAYPGMVVRPDGSGDLKLEGQFYFTAKSQTHGGLTDRYELRMCFPQIFPRALPMIYEVGGRIPRDGNHHVNPDGSLCLGSRLRILFNISEAPTLVGFAETCLVPYLFAVSYKLTHGGNFPFGELTHGLPGELMDYAELFGLKTPDQASTALKYLGMKKRRANKMPCPCGCRLRLGRCCFNVRLRKFRLLADRSWFRSLVAPKT